ncbi:MAG: AarF/ABC1/UbiB kinase family protein [Ardenticatenales bacterium]|nr:AarF/ABC1/UbiB kinase family protein [Ardenticatenales bacterium]
MAIYHPHPADLRRRFWTTSLYLASTLVEIWWWEVVLPYRFRLGFLNRNAVERRQGWAKEYRDFALRMGGVWIKLGQFFSSRADVLPPDITAILADLQDEVQPVPWFAIEEQIIRELQARPEQVFADFDKTAKAAASLGQVHFARLHTGEEVAVKVQRPGIRAIIEVDLRALRGAINTLKNISFIRRRVKLDALYEEFAATLRLELDYVAEARHAEQFAENFKDDPHVDLPRPYWPLTTVRILTLERILGIKINEYEALERAGISRAEVAEKMFSVYLKQVFEDGFFHADPHPGNLFIRPRGESGRRVNRSFDLVFIDFGMVGHISERSRALMRRMVIATVQRDYAELIRLSKELGFLLPEADNRALIAALETLFDRYYGMSMAELTSIDYAEVEQLIQQFRDIIYDFPFQIPQDFIFLGRTLGILSGIATGLDPQFSPLGGLEPFARRLIGAEAVGAIGEAAREASELAVLLVALPRRLDRLLRRIEDGDLAEEAVQPALDRLEGIEGAFNRLTDTIMLIGFSAGWYFTREEEGRISYSMIAGAAWMIWRQLKGRR